MESDRPALNHNNGTGACINFGEPSSRLLTNHTHPEGQHTSGQGADSPLSPSPSAASCASSLYAAAISSPRSSDLAHTTSATATLRRQQHLHYLSSSAHRDWQQKWDLVRRRRENASKLTSPRNAREATQLVSRAVAEKGKVARERFLNHVAERRVQRQKDRAKWFEQEWAHNEESLALHEEAKRQHVWAHYCYDQWLEHLNAVRRAREEEWVEDQESKALILRESLRCTERMESSLAQQRMEALRASRRERMHNERLRQEEERRRAEQQQRSYLQSISRRTISVN